MSQERSTVSVIVPSTALAPRRALIWRAIHSILDQTSVRAVPIVVVNGSRRDPDVTRELMADERLRVRVLERGGLAGALQAGRRLVDSPWFAELDDDDLLMPDALLHRIQALEQDAAYDCVVTNGLRRDREGDTVHIPDLRTIEQDPIHAFFDSNWLLPGSYLCRTDRVGSNLYDGMPESLECSYLALRLAASYRVKFLDRPTVIWNMDTPGSLSKSREWNLAHADAYQRILDLDLPPHARRQITERVIQDCHARSHLHLEEGDFLEAWRWHLWSLYRSRGRHYLLYTRKLLRALLAPGRTTR